MAFLTITKAARVAGVSRGTIYNKIEDGELSKGSQGIDTAELLRVFGTLRDPATDDKPVQGKTASTAQSAMSSEIVKQNNEFTRQMTDQLAAAERDKEYLRKEAEKWEQREVALRKQLDEANERHAQERQTWLDDVRPQLPAPGKNKVQVKGWRNFVPAGLLSIES